MSLCLTAQGIELQNATSRLMFDVKFRLLKSTQLTAVKNNGLRTFSYIYSFIRHFFSATEQQ